VELGEIENVLLQHANVKTCCVVVGSQATDDKTLIAFVVLHQKGACVALQEFLTTKLPSHMVPATWIELDAMPLMPNGKIDRKNLPSPSMAKILRQNHVAARTDTERAIAKIWKDLLNIDDIGAFDDFFLLGGHSLIATRVVSAIQKALHVSVPIKVLFDFKHLHELASYIDQMNHRPIYSDEFQEIEI
jgi:acyl carrier protein